MEKTITIVRNINTSRKFLLLMAFTFLAIGLIAQNDFPIHTEKALDWKKTNTATSSSQAIQFDWEPLMYGYCMYAPDELLGLVNFYPSNTTELNVVKNEYDYLLNAGEYYNGRLYGFTYTVDDSYGANVYSFVRIDPATGTRQTLNYVESAGGTMDSDVVYDMTYSYKDGVMYALKNTSSGPLLTTVKLTNPNAGTHKNVGIIIGGPTRYIGLACHLNGDLYALGVDTRLYKIDLDNLQATLVGNTNYPDYSLTLNIQTMAFDHNSGALYWVTETGDLYVVDHYTGKIRLAGTLSEYSGIGVIALFSIYNNVEENTPGMVRALAVSVGDNGAISSTLEWINPSETAQGKENVQITMIKIYRDDILVHTINDSKEGYQVTWTDFAVTEGIHTYKVVAENENGTGIPADLSVFVGTDTPSLSTNVTLVKDNNSLPYLIWNAPLKGVNKGWIGELKYDIVRMPDNVTVASNLTSLDFTDNLLSNMEYYSYKVIAKNSKKVGEGSVSNSMVFGSATIPWNDNFDDEITGLFWRVIDANQNGECWEWFPMAGVNNSPCVGFSPYLVDFDDWLISPPLALRAGKKYRLRWSESSNDYAEVRYSVYLGVDNTAEGQITHLSDHTTQSFNYTTREQTLPVVSTTGAYHVSWHLKGKSFPYIFIDNVYVDELNDIDLKAHAIESNRNVSVGIPVTTKVLVKNYGANLASNFKVTLYDKTDNILGVSTSYTGNILTDEIAELIITWTPSSALASSNTLKATVEITGDKDLSNNSISTDMLVNSSGTLALNVSKNYVRTGENNDLPFNLTTKTSVAQSIIYENEMEMFGYVESVKFFSRFTVDVPAFPVKIYMASTNEDNLVAWQRDAVLVYEGNIRIPYNASQQYQETEIVFDTPFLYENGNLVIWTERVMHDVVYESDQVHFLRGQSLGTYTPNRTAYYNSDTTPFNFQKGNRVETFAYMELGVNVNGNKLQGTITGNGNLQEGTIVKIKNTSIETISNETGKYIFNFVPEGTHEVSYYKSGYEEVARTITINRGSITTENVNLTNAPTLTISGKVSNGSIGLSNTNVLLISEREEYYTKTDQDGNFTINNVLGKQTYTINAFCSGYRDYKITYPVTSSNITGMNIQLVACSNTELEALTSSINTPDWYTVNLSWDIPIPQNQIAGYRIYRNEELITYQLITTNSYSEAVPVGNYIYGVSVVSTDGCESAQVLSSTIAIDTYECDIPVTNFPYEEGFENGKLIDCWYQEYVSGMEYNWAFVNKNSILDQIPNTTHSGNYYLRIYGDGKGSTARLVSPMMDITSLSNPVLNFWHAQNHWFGSQDILKVFYKNNIDGEWILLTTYNQDLATWTEEVIELLNPTNTYWVAFEGSVNYGRGVALDDIRILDDVCQPVLNFSYNQETETSVTLTWDAPAAFDVSSYTLKRGSTILAENITETTFTETGLTLGTYTYEVIANYDKNFCQTSSSTLNVPIIGMCDPIENLQFEIVAEGSVKLSWEKPNAINIASYTIKRNNQTVGTATADKTDYTESGLAEGDHTYSVIVNYTGKTCNTSQAVSGSILLKTGPVENLKADVVNNNKVVLSWEMTMTDIASFDIYRDGVLIKNTYDQEYSDRNLSSGMEYEYTVRPLYDTGWQGLASSVNAFLDCEEVFNPEISFHNENNVCVATLSWGNDESDQESLIWDNGSFVTYPEKGFSGYDLSTPYNGGSRAGIEIARSLGYYHTDDFSLNKDTYIEEIEFYAYVLSGPIDPSPIQAVYLAIYDGNPKENGVLIWGSVEANNVLKSTEFVDAFRTSELAMSNIERPIYKVVAEVNHSFPKGKYWILITMDGSSIFSTPYTIPVSILGNLNTGDASVYIPDSENNTQKWIDFIDNGNGATYGLPFKVFGEKELDIVDIYRDGLLLASNVIGNSYVDNNIPTGNHTWEIVRKCGGGDSPGSQVTGNCDDNPIDDVTTTSNDDISIYPNPASDHVVISGSNLQRLQIINIEGQIVKDSRLNTIVDKETISLQDCANGIYLLRIYSDKEIVAKKFIIKK